MKYYKYIELNGWEKVAQDILNYVETNTNFLETMYFWNALDPVKDALVFDNVSMLLKQVGLDVRKLAVLIVNEDSVAIHQDTKTYPFGRVNIPLKNCEHSKTIFYQPTKWEPENLVMENGVPYIYHKEENCFPVDQVEIIKPTALRVQELHNVSAKDSIKPRISLTCYTEPDAIVLLEE